MRYSEILNYDSALLVEVLYQECQRETLNESWLSDKLDGLFGKNQALKNEVQKSISGIFGKWKGKVNAKAPPKEFEADVNNVVNQLSTKGRIPANQIRNLILGVIMFGAAMSAMPSSAMAGHHDHTQQGQEQYAASNISDPSYGDHQQDLSSFIHQVSKEAGVNPKLVNAMIAVGSKGNANKVSAEKVGLMQVKMADYNKFYEEAKEKEAYKNLDKFKTNQGEKIAKFQGQEHDTERNLSKVHQQEREYQQHLDQLRSQEQHLKGKELSNIRKQEQSFQNNLTTAQKQDHTYTQKMASLANQAQQTSQKLATGVSDKEHNIATQKHKRMEALDPHLNIQVGVLAIASFIGKYNPNLDQALSAFHSDESKVDLVINTGWDLTKMPNPTQNYVIQVRYTAKL